MDTGFFVFSRRARNGQSAAKHLSHREFNWYEAPFGSPPETRPPSVASKELADGVNVGIGSVDEAGFISCAATTTARPGKGRGQQEVLLLTGHNCTLAAPAILSSMHGQARRASGRTVAFAVSSSPILEPVGQPE